ncbi:Inner membrane protein CreD, partial [Stylophora pistillata]
YSIISERKARQYQVTQEIYQGWGDEQTLSGPFLVIPYVKNSSSSDSKDSKISYQILLPVDLGIEAQLSPKTLYRGIYKAVVYKSHTQLNGQFDLSLLPNKDYLIDEARICLGISDVRGIEKEPLMTWNHSALKAEPGTHPSIPYSGIHYDVSLRNAPKELSFSMNLELKGGGQFHVTPFGKNNQLVMRSSWADPSFIGAYLPTDRKVADEGFEAQWTVPHLARSYPQTFSKQELS